MTGTAGGRDRLAMHIAMIDNSKGWGGAEEVLSTLAAGLVSRGHRVTVFARKGAITVDTFRRAGLEVRPLPRQGIGMIGGMLRLAGMVRRERFDLIHVHRNHDLPAGKIAAAAAGAPLLLTQHCLLGKSSSFLMGLADRIITVSRFIGEDMERRFPSLVGRVEVVHNGIDLRPFENPRPGYWQSVPEVAGSWPLLGVVGYFYKNQEELIDLMPRIRVHLPKAKLIIIGHDDSKWDSLHQYVRECGAVDMVHFAGRISRGRIADALAGLDFNVSAFRREGCALNVIESLAVGTPFIGYRAGSYPELVHDGVTGALAEDRDGFVQALVSLAADTRRIERMREKARQDAEERFAVVRMIDAYEHHYLSLVKGAHGER